MNLLPRFATSETKKLLLLCLDAIGSLQRAYLQRFHMDVQRYNVGKYNNLSKLQRPHAEVAISYILKSHSKNVPATLVTDILAT